MKSNILISYLFFIINLNLFSQEMKTYVNNDYNLSINYPEMWDLLDNPSTVFLFIRPVEESTQLFRENTNLIIDVNHGFTLQEYVGATKSHLKNKISSLSIISTEYIVFNKKQFAEIIYQHSAQNLSLQVVYYVYIQDGKAYNFTCSTTQQNFKKYYPLFEKMIKSFSLND